MKILVVDDSALDRKLLIRILMKAEVPHEILQAEDGEQGLEVLAANHKDIGLILLDWQMPKMSGIEFMSGIVKVPMLADIPIVMVTASSSDDNKRHAYQVNPKLAGYVVKPYKPEELLTTLKSYINAVPSLMPLVSVTAEPVAPISLKSKPVVTDEHSEVLFTLALGLTAAVKKVFFEKSEMKFSKEPLMEKKPIVHFGKRMRIDPMGKFGGTAVASAVHLHKNIQDLEANIPVGLLIVYMEKKFVPEFLRLFKYPYIDYDDDDEVRDGCGAIVNLYAGYFKRELIRMGYQDLEMSHFKSYINTCAEGVDFPQGQTHEYEILFEIDDKKRMAVEMVMAPLPRAVGTI